MKKLHYWYLQSDSIEDAIDHKRTIIMQPSSMEAPADVNYENEGQLRRRPAKPVTQLADWGLRLSGTLTAVKELRL